MRIFWDWNIIYRRSQLQWAAVLWNHSRLLHLLVVLTLMNKCCKFLISSERIVANKSSWSVIRAKWRLLESFWIILLHLGFPNQLSVRFRADFSRSLMEIISFVIRASACATRRGKTNCSCSTVNIAWHFWQLAWKWHELEIVLNYASLSNEL